MNGTSTADWALVYTELNCDECGFEYARTLGSFSNKSLFIDGELALSGITISCEVEFMTYAWSCTTQWESCPELCMVLNRSRNESCW